MKNVDVRRLTVDITHCIAIALFAIAMFFIATGGVHADSPNVTQHSKQEIINYLKSSGTSVSDPVEFVTMPVKNTQRGKLSSSTEQSALEMLNNVRYIAGLDSVSLDTSYSNKAQAAAFSNWAIGELSHYPGTTNGKSNGPTREKPYGMSDSDWSDGKEGARNSNIAYGRDTINDTIVSGWMADSSSASNVSGVGHRRWCLNPYMGKTGFGATRGSSYLDKYYAMWAMDKSASGNQSNVAWPAQHMPIEYFDSNTPWSLSTGDTSIKEEDISNVSVTLTRRSMSPSGAGTWTFSTANSYTAAKIGEYFGVQINNPHQGYSGQPGAFVVFRPADITYRSGDIFDVSISGLGSGTISYTVEFFNGYPVESIEFDKNEYVLTSSYKYIYETIKPADATGYEIEWNIADTSVATVDQNGKLIPVSTGVTTVTATIPGRYTEDGEPRSITATVRVPKNINSSDVTVDNSYTYSQYNGKLQRPEITVKDGDVILEENVDYVLNAPSNAIEPAYHAYSISGIGNYYGTKDKLYLIISKKSITDDMIHMTPEEAIYDASTQTPEVVVKNGDITLTEGIDYTVENNGGINVGEYNVRVSAASGSKYYTGNATRKFAIRAKTLTDSMIELPSDSFTYNGEIQKPTVTIKDGTKVLSEGIDYNLQMDESINSGNYELSVIGRGNYSGSISKQYHINTLDIGSTDISLSTEELEYTGGNQAPSVTVKLNSASLKEDTDYELQVDNAVNVGSNYNVVITGKGSAGVDSNCNFSGSVMKTFSIIPKPLNSDMIILSNDLFVYNAQTQKPAVIVKIGETTLTEDTDYQLVNIGGRDVGAYTVKVTAVEGRNYTGSAEKDYTIKPKPIEDSMIKNVEDRTFDGSYKTPGFSVVYEGENVSNEILDLGGGKDAGTYTVRIKGTGNYTGGASKSYKINPKDINSSDVSFSDGVATYTGSRITPSFRVNDENAAITKNDYSAEYQDGSDGINAGSHNVTITGENNYTGTRTVTFTINKKNIDAKDITVDAIADQAHTGSEIKPALTIKHGGRSLGSDDYTAEYFENIETGTARVVIRGNGNYDGSRDVSFNIIDKAKKAAKDALAAKLTELEEAFENATDDDYKDAIDKEIENIKSVLNNPDASTDDLLNAAESADKAKTAADNQLKEKKAAEESAAKKADEEKVAAEKKAAEETTEDKIAEEVVAGKASDEKAAAENVAVEKATTESSTTEKGAAEETAARADQKGSDGTALGAGASAESAESAILASNSDEGPAGSRYAPLLLKSTSQGKTNIKLTWSKVSGASKYVIYGNACGKKNKMKKLATVKGKTYNVKKISKKLKKGTYHKFLVVALNSKNNVVSSSKVIHVATKGGKVGNHKSVTIKAKVDKNGKQIKKYKALTTTRIKKGKSITLKTAATVADKKLKVRKHRAICYESSNTKIATVNKNGKVKAKKKGTCYIYAYAQNGVFKKIKVVVR